ncbi:MAG TPA: WD40 repeat domain-containing protein [Allosphingosinicella sp.]|jgi:hypothetical protein
MQTQVLLEARRRCCACFGLFNDLTLKKGQISHVDGNPCNNKASNLAFLCLDHHDELDSRTSQSKGLTPQEIRAFKGELAERVRSMNASAESVIPAATPQQRVADALSDNPAAARLLRLFGTPVLPPRPEISAFGRWRRRFVWEAESRLRLGLFLPDLRLAFWTGDGVWNFYHATENKVSERVLIDTSEDKARKAEWLAAKGSVRVYARENGNVAVWEYQFPDDDVKVSETPPLVGHGARPVAAEFDVNSDRFASADLDGEVILWDWPSRSVLGRMHSVISGISSLSHYPDPLVARLVANNTHGEFEVLDFGNATSLGRGKLTIKGAGASAWHAADLAYIVGADEFGRQDVVSSASFEPIDKAQWFGVFVGNCVSEHQRVNAFKNATGQVWLFEREGGETGEYTMLDIVPPSDARVTSMAVSPDGRFFATALDKRVLNVWERIPEGET